MTEDMIRRLPARRDGTGYAFILRGGLSPVIVRPPVIWHGRWRKALARLLRQALAERRPLSGQITLPPPPEITRPQPEPRPWYETVEEPVLLGARPSGDAGPAESEPAPAQADVRPATAPQRRARAPRPWDQLGSTAAPGSADRWPEEDR